MKLLNYYALQHTTEHRL